MFPSLFHKDDRNKIKRTKHLQNKEVITTTKHSEMIDTKFKTDLRLTSSSLPHPQNMERLSSPHYKKAVARSGLFPHFEDVKVNF